GPRSRSPRRRRPIHEASSRRSSVGGTVQFPNGIRLTRSREPRFVRRGKPLPVPPAPRRPRRTTHWCPKSTPHLGIDFLGILFDQPVDTLGFLVQMLQLSE